MKTQWPHPRRAQYEERKDAALLLQQAVATRYQPSERCETLPESYEATTSPWAELVY